MSFGSTWATTLKELCRVVFDCCLDGLHPVLFPGGLQILDECVAELVAATFWSTKSRMAGLELVLDRGRFVSRFFPFPAGTRTVIASSCFQVQSVSTAAKGGCSDVNEGPVYANSCRNC